MYRNIVIEPLGTLIHFAPREYLMHSFMSEKIENEVYDLTFGSAEWQEVLLGNMTRSQADRIILERSRAEHREFEVQAVLDDWRNLLHTNENTVNIVRELKKVGYRVFYLSHCSADMRELFRQRDFWPLFEGGICSCDSHRSMPCVDDLVQLLRENYLLEHETLYLDAAPENSKAAYDIGVVSILFKKDSNHLMKTLVENRIL